MRKLREWILTLGVMAAAPAALMAGPFSLPSSPFKAEKTTNQEVAEKIAAALHTARLQGTDIQIEYNKGVATLMGNVSDNAQKAKASAVAKEVSGVKSVNNKLEVTAASPFDAGTRQAAYFGGSAQPRFSGIQQVSAEQTAAPSNQEVAENIAAALGNVGLNGYDIQISYQNGIASLNGSVASPQQKMMAEGVAAQVAGVNHVSNNLSLPTVAPRQMATGAPAGYPAGYGIPQNYMPAAYQQGPAMQTSAYGMPGAAGSNAVSNSPNLPSYAFPTYAAYPNYSAVSYPKQYGASAWPYIGPFYPYPQVPLGWRKSSLTWDDGSWALEFDSKTDKWWWFMNPKNW
jgi:osmotically-inducible protein OsmY